MPLVSTIYRLFLRFIVCFYDLSSVSQIHFFIFLLICFLLAYIPFLLYPTPYIPLIYDIFVNCNWVATRWQQYSTHLHTNSTQNDTINLGRVLAVHLCELHPWHLPYN
jgi:hypothetical protein